MPHIQNRLIQLKSHFDNGKIPTLEIHEVHPEVDLSSRENYLYFTFPVSINFQRASPKMWESALKTYNDPETNYLFFPEKLLDVDPEKAKEDLFKHRLSLQKNKHFEIWWKLSKTFKEHFNSDPRVLINSSNSDVALIRKLIQIDRKKDFPYLSGTKMANYWLFILSKYTDIKLKNIEQISIIPDTHVMQASLNLGLINSLDERRENVEQLWYQALKETGISPVEMHPILWNWSRNNFKPEV